jgi:predicted HAD superfamily Cof-like phosphohydrolase
MEKHQAMVREFMQVFGQETPETFSPDRFPKALRANLIVEEVKELVAAINAEDWVEVVDALCDILYVTYGAAVALGVDIEPFLEEVHRSNMSKLDPETGRPIYREDGKVVKPPTWSPPDLLRILLLQTSRDFLHSVLHES